MDLVIAGAVIKDHNMIQKAIASAPDYPFSKKFILFDGIKSDKGSLMTDEYYAYTHYIAKKYPEFEVIRFDKNIYFRNMIKYVCKLSKSERLFVIQDDVQCHPMDLEQIVIQMNYLKDLKILCFPHKYIPFLGTPWFEPFDDSHPLPFIKSHGFTERTFLCDRINMLKICETMPEKNKMNLRFIEFIYNTEMNRSWWSRASYDEKNEYWKMFGCYFHYDIHHTHLVGKR
tara:strand:- start:1140 stop:1826 length:687 start_codon:yes stop_codon:yes gene_type:complete